MSVFTIYEYLLEINIVDKFGPKWLWLHFFIFLSHPQPTVQYIIVFTWLLAWTALTGQMLALLSLMKHNIRYFQPVCAAVGRLCNSKVDMEEQTEQEETFVYV